MKHIELDAIIMFTTPMNPSKIFRGRVLYKDSDDFSSYALVETLDTDAVSHSMVSFDNILSGKEGLEEYAKQTKERELESKIRELNKELREIRKWKI